MPLYEYRCEDCQATFERLRPISASDARETCPHCQSPRGERILSAFATCGSDTPVSAAGCGPGGFT